MRHRIPLICTLLILVPAALFADSTLHLHDGLTEQHPGEATGGQFFAALIGGVLLAMGFQVVLTLLSVAIGISAFSIEDDPAELRDHDHDPSADASAEKDSGWHTARMITSTMGLWALLSASAALFFASWLAMALLPATALAEAAVLGLVIWGLFYLLILCVEGMALSSMVGFLGRTAFGGIRSTLSTAGALFSKSTEKRFADAAGDAAKEIKKELTRDIDVDRIEKRFFDAVHELSEAGMDEKTLAQELRKALDETEIRALHGKGFDQDQISAILRDSHKMDAGTAKRVGSKIKQAWSLFQQESQDKDQVSAGTDTALQLAGFDKEAAEGHRQRIEEVLRASGKAELNPESLKAAVEGMIEDPKSAPEEIRRIYHAFDRNTILDLIASGSGRERSEIEGHVTRAEGIFNSLKERLQHRESTHMPHPDQMTDEQRAIVAARANSKIARICNAAGDPELRYSAIKDDLRLLFSEPGTAIRSLSHRMGRLDRDSLVQMLAASSDRLSTEQINATVDKAMSLRDDLLARVEELQKQVTDRYDRIKLEARHQAEEARKTTAVAAWWTFGAAACSAAAAALGGMLGAWS